MMKELSEILKTMDLEFFGTGSHKISVEKAMELLREDKLLVLDVRTKEELNYVVLPFAIHIPLNELPNHLELLSKNKVIAVFCAACTRATIAYTYLLTQGYQAKILPQHLGDIVDNFKPGYVRKHLK